MNTPIPQFQFAPLAGSFNLRGEVAICEPPVPQKTIAEPVALDWFVDHAAVELGRRIIAGESEGDKMSVETFIEINLDKNNRLG